MAQPAVRRVRIKACAAPPCPALAGAARARMPQGARIHAFYIARRRIFAGAGGRLARRHASTAAYATGSGPQDRGPQCAEGSRGRGPAKRRARRRAAWIARRGEKIGKPWATGGRPRAARATRRQPPPRGAYLQAGGRPAGPLGAARMIEAGRRVGCCPACGRLCVGGAHARRLVRHTPRPRERALYAIRRRPPQDRAARAALRLRAIPAAPAATAAGAPTYMQATSRIAAMPCATTEASEAGSACVATWSE